MLDVSSFSAFSGVRQTDLGGQTSQLCTRTRYHSFILISVRSRRWLAHHSECERPGYNDISRYNNINLTGLTDHHVPLDIRFLVHRQSEMCGNIRAINRSHSLITCNYQPKQVSTINDSFRVCFDFFTMIFKFNSISQSDAVTPKSLEANNVFMDG